MSGGSQASRVGHTSTIPPSEPWHWCLTPHSKDTHLWVKQCLCWFLFSRLQMAEKETGAAKGDRGTDNPPHSHTPLLTLKAGAWHLHGLRGISLTNTDTRKTLNSLTSRYSKSPRWDDDWGEEGSPRLQELEPAWVKDCLLWGSSSFWGIMA